MKCKRCGKELEKNARFCVNCGNEVNNQKEPKGKSKGILFKIIIVEIVCILAVVFGLLVIYFLPKVGRKLNIKDGYVTRYEWMEMLCEQFNIEDSEAGQLTFSDVDDKYEDMISNAYGWGILSGKGKFKGDEPASGEFIAITAIRAIGESEVKIYLEKDELKDKDCINLAIEKELLQKKELKSTFTKEECEKILERTSQLSLLELIKDDYLDIEWQDNVILLDDDAVVCALDEETIEVRDEVLKQFELGDILVYKVPSLNLKRVGKVEGIEGNTVQISEVEVAEIAKGYVISDIGELNTKDDLNDILDINGFTEENAISDMDALGKNDTDNENPKVVPLATYERKGFEVRVECNPAEGESTLTLTDYETRLSWQKELDSNLDKDSKDFLQNIESLSAQISIDDILIATQCKKNIWDDEIEYYKMQVDTTCNISADASFTADKKSQRLKLIEIPIKIEGDYFGICSVNIPFYLVVKANGTFAIEAGIPATASVYFEKGRGIRAEDIEIEAEKVDLISEIELQTGIGLEAYLCLVRKNIADMELETRISGKVKTVNRLKQEMRCTDLTITFPIIDVFLGNDANSLLSKYIDPWKFELINEEKPLGKLPLIWNTHIEQTDGQTKIVDVCTYNEEDSSEEPKETANAEDVLFTVTDECQYWFDINNDSGLSFDGTKYYAIGTLGYVVKVPYNPAILQMQLGEKLEICGQRWTSVALSSDEAFYISYDDEGEPTGENPDEWRKLKCDETDATFYLNLSEIYNPETEDRKRIALTDADSSYPGYEFATYGNAVMGGKGLAWASLKKNYRQEFAPDGIIEFSSLYALLSDVRSYSVKEYYQNPVQDDFGRDLVNPCETEGRSGFITLNDQNRVCYYCYFADSPVYEWF